MGDGAAQCTGKGKASIEVDALRLAIRELGCGNRSGSHCDGRDNECVD